MAGRPVCTIKDKDGKTVGHYGDFKVLPIDEPTDNPCEPPMRIDWTNPKSKRKLMALAKLIKDKGLRDPILVNRDGVIIDGHRRRTVCRDVFGWTKIPTNIMPANASIDSTDDFVMLNSAREAIDGCQYLWMYMDGHKIPANMQTRIDQIIRWCGKTRAHHALNRILNKGGSASTYAYSMGMYRKQIKRHPSLKKKLQKAHMNDLMYWMFNVGNAANIKHAIFNLIPVEILVEAVDTRQKLDSVWKVANPKTTKKEEQ